MDTIAEILSPGDWDFTSSKEKLFSSDHVIDAYIKGKNDGLEQAQKLLFEYLRINIDKSGKHTARILEFLRENNFTPISAYLKINSWDSFTLMLALPENEFIDDKIIKAYDFITDFEEVTKEDLYSLNIIICDTEGDLDESYIVSDGFFLKYKF